MSVAPDYIRAEIMAQIMEKVTDEQSNISEEALKKHNWRRESEQACDSWHQLDYAVTFWGTNYDWLLTLMGRDEILTY